MLRVYSLIIYRENPQIEAEKCYEVNDYAGLEGERGLTHLGKFPHPKFTQIHKFGVIVNITPNTISN